VVIHVNQTLVMKGMANVLLDRMLISPLTTPNFVVFVDHGSGHHLEPY
jgi:hypothetical protein